MPSPRLLFLATAFCAAASLLAGEEVRGYYRYPALHGSTVVFTAEGDLWRVPTTGGVAQRVTSHPGAETHPAISPDGQWLAFTGEYEKQVEAYVMPLAGGTPKRLTFEGESSGARVVGWARNGRVLYSTRHYSTLPDAQLVAIDPQTLGRDFIPLAQAAEAAYTDFDDLIFTRLPAQSSHAKNYRGGTAQQLWRWGKGMTEAVKLTPDYDGTSRWPMWWEGRIYFASDRDGTMNLWSMKLDGGDLRQHTRHTDFGVKSPSLSRGRIAYQNGADVWLLDIVGNKTSVIPIKLMSDLDHLREKWVSKPLDYLTDVSLSPSGDRVALTVRGQVFVAPVGSGRLVEVTRQSGVRYRQAAFAGADGKSLIVLSDESGEVEFWRAPANGVGSRTQLTKDSMSLRVQGFPSPDGRWLLSAERSQHLLLYDLTTGEKRQVAKSRRTTFDQADIAWAPDSQWFAFVNHEPSEFPVIHLYSIAADRTTAVTSARTSSHSPAWSPDGKWLYFLSERSLQSLVASPWGLRQPEPFFDKSVKIYQLALSAATRRSPFDPHDELHPAEAAKKDEGTSTRTAAADTGNKPEAAEKAGSARTGASPTRKPAAVVVELDGIQSRLWEVPVAAGNYSNLEVTDKALFFTDRERVAEAGRTTAPTSRLRAVEIKNQDVEMVTVSDGVTSYQRSADGRKLLVRKNRDLFVIDAAAKAATLTARAPSDSAAKSGSAADRSRVPLEGLKLSFQPRESWRQMFTDAWRLHRDYFYDKSMHGVDWKENLAKHEPLVERITDRDELNDALAYMMSELSALHTSVQPGDVRGAPEDENVATASLGAHLVRDVTKGGYVIAKIHRGDPDYPAKLSPLQKPGLKIAEGDVIQSVNGVPALAAPDIGSLLRNQASRQVLLQVQPAAGPAFDAIVTPITSADAASLRYTDWELTRRDQVEQKGGGKIGYVHLRAMGTADYAQWARDYYPIIDRPGLILDLRHNRGGNIESWLLSRLMRKAWMWWSSRDGDPYPNMQNPFRGHLVVLVNEWTASDGETMANGVRRLGLGTLIGTRTWGGGIWLRAMNRLVDRGIITAAESGSFVPDEGWVVEGPGITPDFIVDNPPAATFRGEDAQLDAAIAKLQELLARDPRPAPSAPPPAIIVRPKTT